MILGTVELGLSYGINNRNSKPDKMQAFSVLREAWINGIRELDTAAAYGNSEKLIGQYCAKTGHSFRIDTKLPVSISKDRWDEAFNSSCERLNTKDINVLYLHCFDQCKDKMLMSYLLDLKSKGRIRSIGISIYEPEELNYILDNVTDVDVVQFPFNILDNMRWKKGGLLQKATNAGIVLYVRSVYLQGLIFRMGDDPFVNKLGISRQVNLVRNLCKETGMSIQQFANCYILGVPQISDVILGCQSPAEVKENAALVNNHDCLPNDIVDKLEMGMCDIPITAIDPRKWDKI